MSSSRRVRCTCGTRIKLAKGQPLPACSHRALTREHDPAFIKGPADYFQFFAPRINLYALAVDRESSRGTGEGQRVSTIPP